MITRLEILNKVKQLNNKSKELYTMYENGKLTTKDLYKAYLASNPIDIENERNILFNKITKLDEKYAQEKCELEHSKQEFLINYLYYADFDLNDADIILSNQRYHDALNLFYTEKIVQLLETNQQTKEESRIELISWILEDLQKELDDNIKIDINKSFLINKKRK